MTILATASLDGFFQGALEDAMKARRIEASPGTTSYLAGVLSEFAKPDAQREATLDRPLAFLLDEALHTNDLTERFSKLRALGDGTLYSTGFFLDHFERRGVDQSYLVSIGSRAYESAGTILSRGAREEGGPDIFGELARKFEAFVALVTEVANLTLARGVQGVTGLLKLYERWEKTQSETLAGALSAHGFQTPRGKKVLQ
jgi:hypothetical protein